jgi:hypothetical protein
MPEIIDTPVVVELSSAGDPRAFTWDRFEHTIVGQPQAIFSRTHWWANDQSFGMKDLNRIDTELWRVDASRGGEEQRRYDLRRDADGTWVLALDWG